jgi:pimeloyl-ACP methyl ester carboxylesterase
MTAARLIHLHGRDVWTRTLPGDGAPVLLVHGIASSQETWGDIPERLSEQGIPVVVVDLPGHGNSSKAPGDYSLGSMASTLRDLLEHLGHDRVHLVGHSLGGGISMQFTYQFPDRPLSLTLVSSGGLGEEVFPGLRAAALPGADLALRLALNKRTLAGLDWAQDRLAKFGFKENVLNGGAMDTVRRLSSEEHRAAFLSTVRSVISTKGQRVSALDKLALVNGESVLIVWGDKDPMIPLAHGQAAHALLPGSELIIFPGAGHEPHAYDSDRFVSVVSGHIKRHSLTSTEIIT